MVRWNAGTEHVKTQRQTLSPARPKIEFRKGSPVESLHKAGVLAASHGLDPGTRSPFRRHGFDDEYRLVASDRDCQWKGTFDLSCVVSAPRKRS
jgi:hypothetical protein